MYASILLFINHIYSFSSLNRAYTSGKFYTNEQWSPNGRFSHSSIFHKQGNKEEIWIIGGAEKPYKKSKSCIEDAAGPISVGQWMYSIPLNKWLYKDTPFRYRRGATLVGNNKNIYLQGGGLVNKDNPFKSIPLCDLWEYKNNKWREIKTNNPDIYCHQSVIDNRGYIYSLGGYNSNGMSQYLYIFNGIRWSRVNSPFKTGIYGHTTTLVDDELIYIIGGVCGDASDKEAYNKDVWTYNIYNGKWNIESGGICIQGHSANKLINVVTIAQLPYCNDDIIFTGGFYPTKNETNDEGATHLGGTSKNIYCYNTRKRVWRMIGNMIKPREFHTSILHNNRLFIFGGYHIGNFWDDGEIIYLD